MDQKTVEIGGASYAIGKLSAKKQFHVARRLGPFVGGLLPHLATLKNRRLSAIDRAVAIVPAIADTLAGMNDEEVDYVLDTCLAVVSYDQVGAWVKLTNQTGGFMFPIDMVTMLRLASEVIVENLASFFPFDSLEESAEAISPSPSPA